MRTPRSGICRGRKLRQHCELELTATMTLGRSKNKPESILGSFTWILTTKASWATCYTQHLYLVITPVVSLMSTSHCNGSEYLVRPVKMTIHAHMYGALRMRLYVVNVGSASRRTIDMVVSKTRRTRGSQYACTHLCLDS